MLREPPVFSTCPYFTPINCCLSGVIWTVPAGIDVDSEVGAVEELAPPSS
jgi:hypothetical protein